MAKKKEISVEEKLRALYDLQLIDSRIDEIRNVRGELPLEVEDLEDEVAGLNTRISNLNQDTANLETDINNKKLAIEESNGLMKKYDEQQKKVRNNREFDSLSKEIEYQDLEIQQGMATVEVYKSLMKLPVGEKKDARKNMLEYCKLDTYAVLELYNNLHNL